MSIKNHSGEHLFSRQPKSVYTHSPTAVDAVCVTLMHIFSQKKNISQLRASVESHWQTVCIMQLMEKIFFFLFQVHFHKFVYSVISIRTHFSDDLHHIVFMACIQLTLPRINKPVYNLNETNLLDEMKIFSLVSLFRRMARRSAAY